ncbi:MAG: SDR family NAD(P)-dependent oxidoreductase [Polyangiaceae bacterium]|nr:SDR family NAD(P)-dependent oxidoreductase [Polyangiaceae bacterium]MCB9609366.1 SDR family NAD(P)-dependent oxidoreductase [Polyangiaceae bacterium]
MKAVILGATSGIGRSLARRLAESGSWVFLLGRDSEELAKSASDLEARHPNGLRVGFAACDLEAPDGFDEALNQAEGTMGGFDTVILTAAMFAPQEELAANSELAQRLMTVNFTNSVAFCECARKRLLAHGGGTLVVLSSVAGERGRKPVAIYGASKAGLSAYLEALDHTFHTSGLRVLDVRPGFVRTRMTADLTPPPFAGDPDGVAKDIQRALEGDTAVLHTPRIWGGIMGVVRRLPRAAMRRANF